MSASPIYVIESGGQREVSLVPVHLSLCCAVWYNKLLAFSDFLIYLIFGTLGFIFTFSIVS